MIQPIKAIDLRRSIALGQVYRDLIDLNHRLDIITDIPFNKPIILIQNFIIKNFKDFKATLIVEVKDMDMNCLICVVYASDSMFLFLHEAKETTSMMFSLEGVVQWRLLDSAFLGTTINYPVKTFEYSKLFNMEL